MNKIICSLLAIILGSCSYSINMVHTQGTASDVVDEQQSPSADISPDIKVSPI